MAEEKTEPYQWQSQSSLETSSGRVCFMGINMAFLTVNGHQMFTLNEILEKLFPNTPRTTVCGRFEKMNAVRHACSKQEIQILKALGGTGPSAINCTMIARKHVAEYFEKFNMQNERKDKGKSLSTSKVTQPNDHTGHEVSDPDGSEVSPRNEDLNLKCRKNRDVNKVSAGEENEVESKTHEFEEENDDSDKQHRDEQKQSVHQSNSTRSDSWGATVGQISQLSGTSTGRTNAKHKQAQNSLVKRKAGKPSNSSLARKRKRRTNLEILRSYSGEIADGLDGSVDKRQRKASDDKGKGNRSNSTAQRSLTKTFQGNQFPASTVPSELPIANPNNEQARHALNLDCVVNVERKTLKCYLDYNNNEVEPRSPTLLLKRSVNNEWRIAESSLPRLGFDNQTLVSAGESLLSKVKPSNETNSNAGNGTMNSVACRTPTSISKTKAKAKVKVKSVKKTQSKQAIASDKNKKSNDFALARRISMKKRGRPNKERKTEAIRAAGNEREANDMIDLELNPSVNSDENKSGNPQFVEDHSSSENMRPGKASSLPRDVSVSKPKDNYLKTRRRTTIATKEDATNKWGKPNENKPNGDKEGSKPKRRRRVQLNTFRLVETLPYPSLLMVKDGDLCPSYTMTYNSAKNVPGCCHPLWRWRLGKPVLPPKQSQMNSIPVENQTENCEKEGSMSIRNGDISSKDSSDTGLV